MQPQAVHPESAQKTQYVLSGQPTGWAAMANLVREYDEERVKDCKEDIDTLLVFAGLFSAVLSAFVIAAYPALQPDPSDRMIQILETIAAQTNSYNLNGSTLHSTAGQLSDLTPFEPSASDVRINVLWFASLIVSLVTASFGILVKQWLREFMAVNVRSPQARLRLRHFRSHEVHKWKVFEIASCLPLLLQLSLGLFFVGLCYFTASLHIDVGHTVLPLVAAWAFCLLYATCLPIFFPRCPYKTTILKNLFTTLHRRLSLLATRRYQARVYVESTRSWLVTCVRDWIEKLEMALWRDLPQIDEAVLIKQSWRDIDILTSVDIIQSNDELLATTIAESLHAAQPRWTEAIRFVTNVLAVRLQLDMSEKLNRWGHTIFDFDVETLALPAMKAILDIVVQYTHDLQLPPYDHTDTFNGPGHLCAYSLLVSCAASQSLIVPRKAFPFLKLSLEESGSALCGEIIRRSAMPGTRLDSERTATVLVIGLLAMVRPLEIDYDNWLGCYEGIVLARLENIRHSPASVPSTSFWNDGHLAPWHEIWPWYPTTMHAFHFLLGVVHFAFERHARAGTKVSPKCLAVFSTACAMTDHLPPNFFKLDYGSHLQLAALWDVHAISLIDVTFFRPTLDVLLAMPFQRLHRMSESLYQRTESDFSDKHDITANRLISLTSTISHQLYLHQNLPDSLKLCFIAISRVDPPRSVQTPAMDRERWKNLFSSVTTAVTDAWSSHRSLNPAATSADTSQSSTPIMVGVENVSYQAECCLAAIHRIETGQEPRADKPRTYEAWSETDGNRSSMFPDELVEVLSEISRSPLNEHIWRVRRLQETKQSGHNGHAIVLRTDTSQALQSP